MTKGEPMRRLLRLLNDLPIARKLLLTSVIPLIALVVLSALTYRTVRMFAEDQEELNRVYLTQRISAEYML
jgi:hypothetical protein